MVTQPWNPEPMFLDDLRRKPKPPKAAAPARGAADPEAASSQMINEALLAGGALVVGLLVTPALFWMVAPGVIGPYTRGTDGHALGIFAFLNDYFGQLGHGSQMAWIVALGPLLMLSFARLVWTFLLRPKAQLEP